MGKKIIMLIIKSQIFIPSGIIIFSNILGKCLLDFIINFNFFKKIKNYESISYELILCFIKLLIIICTLFLLYKIIFFLLHIIDKNENYKPVSLINFSSVNNDMFTDVYAFIILAMEAINTNNLIKVLNNIPYYILIIILFLKIISNSTYPNYIFKIIGFNVYKVNTKNNIEKILISKKDYSNIGECDNVIEVIELDKYILLEFSIK